MTANPSTKPQGCSSTFIFAAALFWIVFIASVQVGLLVLSSAFPSPDAYRLSIWLALGQIFLVALPSVPLALKWRDPAYVPIFRAWALANGFALFLLPVRLLHPIQAQAQAILHILLGILFLLTLRWILRRGNTLPASQDHRWLPVMLLAAGLISYPWAAWGALGSPLDTVLQLAAALVFGAAAGILIDYLLLHSFSSDPSHSQPGSMVIFFAALGVLVLLASGTGFPFGSMQILLGLVWIGSALTAVFGGSLARKQGYSTTHILTLLFGLAAAAPLVFIDADELYLLLGAMPGEIYGWAMRAGRYAAAIGLIVGLGLILVIRGARADRTDEAASRPWLRSVPAFLALAAWAGLFFVYLLSGQPGFFGDRLFVIMEDQADLSKVETIPDYQQRRAEAYTLLVNHARTSQADLLHALDRFRIAYTPYYLESAVEVLTEPVFALFLASQPGVKQVLQSPRLRPLPEELPQAAGDTNTPPEKTLWNQSMVRADKVWNELGITGEGIVVGQSDTGADWQHPELTGGYLGSPGNHDYHWLDTWFGRKEPYDWLGHGTHTLGTAVGKRVGIAPGASWYACANQIRGAGNPALYLDCMQFMLAPYPMDGDPFQDGDPSRGAHVSTNSWGCPDLEGCDDSALEIGIAALRSAGVFVVAAAGNTGPQCSSIYDPPALYPGVITVGGVDSQGELVFFSSRGPTSFLNLNEIKPDLVAPGSDVLSAFPGNTFIALQGTSMATPHVAGVVALMWSANSSLVGDMDATENILHQSAAPYKGSLPDCPGSNEIPSTAVGFGIVDAYAAVQAAMEYKP